MAEVTVWVNWQDTVDWLEGNGTLADRYLRKLANMIQELEPNHKITVDWWSGMGHEIVTDPDDYELRDEVRMDYETTCDQLANDWSWAD